MTKTDFDAKLSGFNKKITKNKTYSLLVKNESVMVKVILKKMENQII